MLKRTLAMLLVASMVFSIMALGVSAQAEETQPENTLWPETTQTETLTMPTVDMETTEPSQSVETTIPDGSSEVIETTEAIESVEATEPLKKSDATAVSDELTVVSLELDPLEIIEGTWGSKWEYFISEEEGYGSYYRYYWYNYMQYTVIFSDGTSYSGTGASYLMNDGWYGFDWSDPQSGIDPWTMGNTYAVTVSAGACSAELSVTIIESPLESITVEPVTMIENNDGHWDTTYNPETGNYDLQYFYYYWWDRMQYTLTFKDGTTQSGSGSGFYYNDEWYNVDWNDPQYENHWTVGNIYTVPIHVMGCSADVAVSIVDTPIESIDFEPVSFMEGTDGSLQEESVNGTTQLYYRYDLYNGLIYTIHFVDGTTYEGGGSYFSYGGYGYSLSWEDPQSYENQWTVGNTYTVNVSALNYTTQVQVTITESPLESITVQPVTLTENSRGNWQSSYNSETGVYEPSYFSYDHWYEVLEYELTFADGTTKKTSDSGFSYGDYWYSISRLDDQSSENPWTAGNTYTAKIAVMGQIVPVSITIEPVPLTSITVEPILLEENGDGYHNGSYFDYGWENMLSYTLTFEDGTTKTGTGTGFYYNDEYCQFGVADPQSSNLPWLVGNTYCAQLLFGQLRTDVYATVCTTGSADGFDYILQNDMVFITGCTTDKTALQIPEMIGTYPVKGVLSLEGEHRLRELMIPDCVSMLGTELFSYESCPYLQKLTLGSGVSNLSMDMFLEAEKLSEIQVSEEHPDYCSADGVVYDKAMTTVVVIPVGKLGSYTVPDSVTNADVIFDHYSELRINLEFGENVKGYVKIDGVTYNEEMTRIYACDKDKTGLYVMPDTVTEFGGAFQSTALTGIQISSSVTEIAYGQFFDCIQLKDLTLPDGMESIHGLAFEGCNALENIYISDMAMWCSMDYNGGLLQMADNLYLDGELVEDLVIPESVKQVTGSAFAGYEKLKSVTVHSGVTRMYNSAFAYCTGLENIYIEDLASWCGIAFGNAEANPMYYADNLYVDGKLTMDIQIPDSQEMIKSFAFSGLSSLESVTIPDSVTGIGSYAFYRSGVKTVDIGNGVKRIGEQAFANSKLQSVIIPDSVTEIGMSGFSGCTDLKEVSFGNGISYIGVGWFSNTGLTEVVLPENITSVASRAFSNCMYLDKVTFEADNVSLNDGAFSGCSLKQLELGNNITSIGWETFSGIAATSVKIPDSVTSITYRAFAYSYDLLNIDVPDQLESLSGNAFDETAWYNAQPDGPVYLENYFYGWKGEMPAGTHITVKDGTRLVASLAFEDEEDLHSVSFPDGLYGIGSDYGISCGLSKLLFLGDAPESYVYLNDLEAVAFYPYGNETWTRELMDNAGGGINWIPMKANGTCGEALIWVLSQAGTLYIFGNGTMDSTPWQAYADSITAVEVDAYVPDLSANAFAGCSAITQVTFTGDAPAIAENAFAGVTAQINYPDGNDTWSEAVGKHYGGTLSWVADTSSNKEGICGDDLTWTLDSKGTLTISGTGQMYDGNDQWYAYRESIKRIIVQEGVTGIGNYAFSYLYGVEQITLPNTLQYIGDEAFYAVGSTESPVAELVLPEGLTTIANYAFANAKIQKINLPGTLTEIGDWAFENSGLTQVTVSEGITSLPWGVFSECRKLREVALPDSLTSIEHRVFHNCEALEEIVISDSVTYMGDHVFSGCDSLKTVILGNSLTEIPWGTFMGCGSLETVRLGEQISSIGNDAFYGCGSLKNIELPASLKLIERYAFYQCRNLQNICYLGSGELWDNVYLVDGNSAIRLGTVHYGHDQVIDSAVAATCTETGLTEGIHCGACGKVLAEQQVLEATGHSEVITPAVAATCTQNGLTEGSHCENCGIVFVEQELIRATGHSYTPKVIKPTCIEFGYMLYSCTCGVSYEDEFTMPEPLNHDLVIQPATEPTCTQAGTTEGKYCSICNTVFAEQLIKPTLGHTEVIIPAVAATCTETGWTEGRSCTTCGEVLKERQVTPALGHEEVIDPGIEPTCSKNGLTEGSHCGRCGIVLTAQRIIEVTEHVYYPHVVAPTCTAQGYTEYICECGLVDYKEDYQAALGHVRVTLPAVAPTCTQTGLTVGLRCSRCEMDLVAQQVLPMVAHSYEDGRCTVCGKGEYAVCAVYEAGVELSQHESFTEALALCDGISRYMVLIADTQVNVSLKQDLYIDLNGCSLSGVINTNGWKVYGMDSATDQYTCDTLGYMNCVDSYANRIVPERHFKAAAEMTGDICRYMAIETENGWTFHRFYLGITNTSLKPDTVGVGYKAEFYGDDMVKARLDSFGYTMRLEGLNAISRGKSADSFASGKTVTLRINNYDAENYGETALYASVYMQLSDGTLIQSADYTLTLRQLLEEINTAYTAYSNEQLEAVETMILANPIMKKWNVGNLYDSTEDGVIDISIENDSDGTP